MELDLQVSPEEIMSREVELGYESWTSFGSSHSSCSSTAVQCDSAQTQQFKQQLSGAQVAGQWRGDTVLTLPLFWRRSTVSPVSFGRYPRSSLHSSAPSPPPSPPPSPVPIPITPPRFRARKAKQKKNSSAQSSGALTMNRDYGRPGLNQSS